MSTLFVRSKFNGRTNSTSGAIVSQAWILVVCDRPDSGTKNPPEVDDNIVTKYNVRKDWRFIAHNKQRGIANLQYIRHERFYIIMATKGWHEFKNREENRIRDARKFPILIPRQSVQFRLSGRNQKRNTQLLDAYAVSYRRGGYLRKTQQEKLEYRKAMEVWKQRRIIEGDFDEPKPPRGTLDPKWHSCVEIERRSYQRLRAYFLDIARTRSLANLTFELTQTGFVAYQPVKRQLVRITKDVNQCRRQAGCREQIPYRVVLGLKRPQLNPFAEPNDFHSAA